MRSVDSRLNSHLAKPMAIQREDPWALKKDAYKDTTDLEKVALLSSTTATLQMTWQQNETRIARWLRCPKWRMEKIAMMKRSKTHNQAHHHGNENHGIEKTTIPPMRTAMTSGLDNGGEATLGPR